MALGPQQNGGAPARPIGLGQSIRMVLHHSHAPAKVGIAVTSPATAAQVSNDSELREMTVSRLGAGALIRGGAAEQQQCPICLG